jgi:hypothetical protein
MKSRNIITPLFLSASVFALSSCEKEIKVELPDYPQQLVIYSMTDATTEAIRATSGKSLGILKYNGSQDLYEYNAKVDIYVDGAFTQTMEYFAGQGMNLNAALHSTVAPEYGKIYTLKATAPGYPNIAEATATVPSKVTIKEIRRVRDVQTIHGIKDEVTIVFDDPAGTKDFYMVNFALNADSLFSQYGSNICVNTTDPSIEKTASNDIIPVNGEDDCLWGDLFFRDELFNGTTKELTFYVSSYYLDPIVDFNGNLQYPEVKLSHISEDYLRFRKTLDFVENNEGNPFSEPSNVYSNIKNGFGIFTISTSDSKEIR